MRNMLHRDYFTIIRLALKWGEDRDIYIEDPSQFPLFYDHKYKSFIYHIPFAIEVEFIEHEMKQCEQMVSECEEYNKRGLGNTLETFPPFDIGFELLLIKRWREYLTRRKQQDSDLVVCNSKGIEVPTLTFESMFYERKYASIALQVLKDLDPPILDSNGHYIGRVKGVFKVWIEEMRKHKPCLVVPMSDMQYRNILNEYIKGLNLSKDASELRKSYKRVDTMFKLNLASLLRDIFKSSQSSQSSQNY